MLSVCTQAKNAELLHEETAVNKMVETLVTINQVTSFMTSDPTIDILSQWPTIRQGETAADYEKRQKKYLGDVMNNVFSYTLMGPQINPSIMDKLMNHAFRDTSDLTTEITNQVRNLPVGKKIICLLYTSPSPRDKRQSRMPSSA